MENGIIILEKLIIFIPIGIIRGIYYPLNFVLKQINKNFYDWVNQINM